MIPQPMAIFLVSRAMSAVTAVEERASMECLRHQGYASASQKLSNPACSQAWAMRSVSATGSMLSCKTPIRKGTLIVGFDSAYDPEKRLWIRPGMLQALDQGPHGLVQGSWDS